MTSGMPGRPRRRRVLLTTDTAGGVWNYSMELAAALEREGVAVTLAALGSEPSPGQRRDAELRGLPLRSFRCRLPWMPEPWQDVSAAGRWLRALADEVAADIVHLNEPVLAAPEWPVPTLVAAHSCVLSWWEAVLGEPAPRSWDRYRDAMRAGLAAAHAVVAPSRAMLGAVRRHYGVRNGRVIPNGRDPTGLQPEVKDGYVLTAARLWDGAKNVAALDRAAAGLAWPVYAAGDPASPDGKAVTLTHAVPLGQLDRRRLAGWMSRAAVFALPARYEPFGLSVLEAALAGCALVLGDIPSLREHWDGIAIFVPPDDPELLRLALTSLIEDPQLRHTLAMRARRRALGFSARRMARAYLTEYDAVLAGRVAACAS
ncbi:MAG TPA: glycosyltransferase family 4 protein [Gemmatimonadales bacterium]|nr:glycosyltransferase family 4 protein [Gemmatimonadales bacterium]